MSKVRQRLDAELLRRGFFQTRGRAQAAIMAGVVLVNGAVQTKAGQQVTEDVVIELLKDDCPYVSRGGLKLKAALELRFQFNFQFRIGNIQNNLVSGQGTLENLVELNQINADKVRLYCIFVKKFLVNEIIN